MIERFLVILGAMRCGTTSLFHYLSEHPEIAPCSDKEPAFFSGRDKFARGRDWYEGLWKFDPARHTLALEASTNYSKVEMFPGTAERMAGFGAEFRLIYLMRNPLDRIESHYTLGAAKGWPEGAAPLSEGVHPELIRVSSYATQIEEYLRYFPRSSLLLLRFEELRADPARVLKQVCEFAGIDPGHEFRGLETIHNSNMGRRPGELGSSLYRYREWIPFWKAIAHRLSPRLINRVRGMLAQSSASNVALSPEQRRELLAELSEELRRLREQHGFETSAWQALPE